MKRSKSVVKDYVNFNKTNTSLPVYEGMSITNVAISPVLAKDPSNLNPVSDLGVIEELNKRIPSISTLPIQRPKLQQQAIS